MTDDAVARKVTVQGRVQGVFFRDSCSREAQRAGVTGWVRNEPDGSVAAHFEGPAAAVAHMVAWCHEGPPHARVEEVLATQASATGASGFDVRM
jgi:acylphosphatase